MSWCTFCKANQPVETGYSSGRDPDLPWGYWLRQVEAPRRLVVDRDGSEWGSVREAFWVGRMGMRDEAPKPDNQIKSQSTFNQWQDDQSELLLAVLLQSASPARRALSELAYDVFHSSRAVATHYRNWLKGHGLLVDRTFNEGRWALTDEGWAVLLMLKATRPEELAGIAPGDQEALAGGPDMAHVANPAVDVSGARFVFERGQLAGSPVITLIDRDGRRGRMPMQNTIWSCAFSASMERDRLFEWMCARSDRWQAWGEMGGGDALTQHLLNIYIASVDWRSPQDGPQLRLAHSHPTPA